MLTVAIGYDHRESIAFHVLAHSILRRASRPVQIVPLALSTLPQFTRPRSPMQSTDFTYSRFLTPSLADENAVSIFMDCDMLCLGDICELEDVARANTYADCLVVKHDYTPRTEDKFLGAHQTTYPCKNWSSLIVFNGWRADVKRLSPDVVNTAEAMWLHQFKWCANVGELDPAWNHLVGEYERNRDAKLIHYTLGGPWFKGYQHCEYSTEWYDELADMLHRDQPSFDLVRQWRY